MIPIPSFNPLDTITYPDGNGVINVGAADAGSKILLYNETQANLDIDFYNGNQSILHAWEARYWTVDGDTKQLGWSINSELNMSNPPISLVIGELYGSTERVEGNYPAPIIRQTSTGNPGGVQANVTQLVNTGAVSGTNVVTVNSTAAAGSTATLTNDGLFQLLVTIAGLLVNAIKTNETDPILQLGALAHLVEVLGNLQVDGNLNGAFTMSTATSHGILQAVPASGLYLKDSGGNNRIACDIDNTFIEAGTGNVQLQAPAGTSQVTVASALTTVSNALTLLSTLLLNNNTAIQVKDSGGTARNILHGDASNLTHLRSLATGAQVTFEDSTGAQLGWFDGGGGGCKNGTFQAPKFQFTTGSLAHFDKVNFTAAAGTYPTTKTYNHGLTYTPDFIIIMPGQDVNSFGSCTTGVWNWNATTFDVTLGAQINFQAFFMKINV